MYQFKRPEDLEVPQIYYTFKAKDKNGDQLIEYRVQDLPQEHFEETVKFMVKYFLPDETFCSSKNIPNKPNAIESFSAFWLESLQENLSIACYKNDDSNELVAANVLIVSSKDDVEPDVSEATFYCECFAFDFNFFSSLF
jgi:GNAT superfamily N-acetyltransferase